MSNTDLISRLYETSQALEHLAQHLAELEVDNTEAEAIEADSDDSENLTEPVEAETEAETKAEIEIEAKAEKSTSAETARRLLQPAAPKMKSHPNQTSRKWLPLSLKPPRLRLLMRKRRKLNPKQKQIRTATLLLK